MYKRQHGVSAMDYIYRSLFPNEEEPKTWLEMFLITTIILSVVCVVLETETLIQQRYDSFFFYFEVVITILFSLEYLTRLILVKEYNGKRGLKAKLSYLASPMAICDLIAIIPSFLIFLSGDLLLLRIFRLFRMLRILKLLRGNKTIKVFIDSLVKSRSQLVLSLAITVTMIFFGAILLYAVEGPTQPEAFGSIPRAMWWSMATLTTVGYGDIYPLTPLGKILASFLSILGIGIVALPAGVIAANFNSLLERGE